MTPYILHFSLAITLAFISFTLCRRVLLPVLHRVIGKTKTQWDDILLDTKVLNRGSWMITGAALILYTSTILTTDH